MITQNKDDKQQIISNVNENIPAILVNNDNILYILIDDFSIGLEDFICSNKNDTENYHMFDKKRENEMTNEWINLDLEVTYRNQQMTYMHKTFTITYPHISAPDSIIKISLIPWFMLPGRPFPTFAYIYAYWHYNENGKKSLRQSAAATSKIFGINGINKSTVYRNNILMEQIIGSFNPEVPLSAEKRTSPTSNELISLIPEILKNGMSIESMEETYEVRATRLPACAKRANPAAVLSGIPFEYSQMIKTEGIARKGSRDARIRPARPRGCGEKPVQRPIIFIKDSEINKVRIDFIAKCKNIVLDAAITYHRFLL